MIYIYYIYKNGILITCILLEPYSTNVTVWFMQLYNENSLLQVTRTPIHKGARVVMQQCLLTATIGKNTEEQTIHA